jgi:hypothetical protein
VTTQRIVRQAAVALRDLHTMAGSIHLDLKINNLLVRGTVGGGGRPTPRGGGGWGGEVCVVVYW